MVPSISFSSACCTPSPDTSRVIDGLSDLREILSISSMYKRCPLRLLDVVVALLQQLLDDVLDVLADVAGFWSASSHRPSRTARSACAPASAPAASCPTRSGPMSRMLLWPSSTSSPICLMPQPLVVVRPRPRECACRFLPDHILIEQLKSLRRRQVAFATLPPSSADLIANDVVAEFDALVADEHRRPAMSFLTSCWLLPQNEQ